MINKKITKLKKIIKEHYDNIYKEEFLIIFSLLTFLDILFLIFTGVFFSSNILFLLVNNCIISLILSEIIKRNNNIGTLITIIYLFLIILFFVAEILIYKIYTVIMPISSLFLNAKNVTDNYSNELRRVIVGHIWIILILLINYLLSAIYLAKCFYKRNLKIRDKGDSRKLKRSKTKKVKLSENFIKIITNKKILKLTIKNNFILIFSILVLIFSYVFIDRHFNFSIVGYKYGLKSAFVLDIFHKDTNYDFQIEENKTVDIIKDKNSNYLDFDFIKINESENDNNIININNYISSLIPSLKNEYTGIFKNKNLILICAEAFSHHVIDKELTPTLYRLVNNGFRFNDFYVPTWGGSTTSGEFAFLTGLIPCDATESMKNTINKNMCFTLPRVLKRNGYNTGAYHNGQYEYYDRNLTHIDNIGFDYFCASGNGLDAIAGQWATDKMMIEKTLDTYIDKGPFCMYYMTISGHAFYNNSNEFKVTKSIEKVKERHGNKYPEQVNNYICYQIYLEEALKVLIDKLEEKNMLNDTVICMVSDHFPYGLKNNVFTEGVNYLYDLYGDFELDEFKQDENMPILWSGCLENEFSYLNKDIDEPTSSIDLVPTLLNLFGADFDSRLFAGRDVFSDAMPIVIYNSGAFITSSGKFYPMLGKFITNDGSEPNKEYVDNCKEYVKNKLLFSKFVVDNDYFDYLASNENVNEEIKNIMSFNIDNRKIILKDKTLESLKEYFKLCNKKNNIDDKNENENEKEKIIYLTFDDGPGKQTRKIIEILKKFDAKATFFVLKNDRDDLINLIKNEGHTIGLHSNSHNYSYIYLNELNFLTDLYEIQNSLYKVTNEYINIIRFPGGSNNTISNDFNEGIMEELKKLVNELGFVYYDWNISTGDSNKTISSEDIFNSFLKGIEKGYRENFVLLHDLFPNTVEALEMIINYGIENGYKFKSITNNTLPFQF